MKINRKIPNLRENNVKNKKFGLRLVDQMEQITFDRIGKKSISNIKYNLKYLDEGQSIGKLKKQFSEFDHAIIIAAGPSIKRMDPIKEMKRHDGFKGKIISTDSGLQYCLKNNVIPDLVVTIDPHESRIIRWFGNPNLNQQEIDSDDYYRRQDMDEDFSNEISVNTKLINRVNTNCKGMPIALSTASSKAVVERVISVGMDIYWFNPMLDNPDLENSHTMAAHRLNKLPCINCGGNVGTTAWMILDEVLKAKTIALTGVDFSYYSDTSYLQTQYYHEAVEIVGEENLDEFFIKVFNPYLDKWFFTDPAYYWYRQAFLEMVRDGSSITYNCTNGGILFGENVKFTKLNQYLTLVG